MKNRQRDYMPTKSADFNMFFKNITQNVGLNFAAWGHIPVTAQTALNSEYGAFYSAYAKTLIPHSKVETTAKRDAQRNATKALRMFINQYLRFSPVTNDERVAMNIPNRDEIRTSLPPPKEEVEISLVIRGIRRVEVHFKVKGNTGRAKPYGCTGAAIKWLVSDSPAQSTDHLGEVRTATRTPYILNFSDEQRGKVVSIAMCWENRKGERGQWSEIISTFVP